MKKYGNLTDRELYALLDEIENEDEDLRREEGETPPPDDAENIAAEDYYGEDAWRARKGDAFARDPAAMRRLAEISAQAKRQKVSAAAQTKTQIQRDAFRQNVLPLSDPIPDGELKELIRLLTLNHSLLIEKYKSFIDRRLTKLLNPFLPQALKMCRTRHPQAVPRSPGFLYRAGTRHGGGHIVWATPDIPNYFAPGTERTVIAKARPGFLVQVDKAVAGIYRHERLRSEKELRYASQLVRANPVTYYDLLKLNPFWFDTLYRSKLKDENTSD